MNEAEFKEDFGAINNDYCCRCCCSFIIYGCGGIELLLVENIPESPLLIEFPTELKIFPIPPRTFNELFFLAKYILL